MRAVHTFLLIAFFATAFSFYYFFSFESVRTEQVFLSIATFLFAIFVGFFISRQSSRYSAIREKIAVFDGSLSFIYRGLGHLETTTQEKSGRIIKEHYEQILANKSWDYYFNNKSSTLTSLHQLLESPQNNSPVPGLGNAVLNRVITALYQCQQSRKALVSLYGERIPTFQWLLLAFLGAILLVSLSTSFSSQHKLLASILKAAFAMSVLTAILLLRKLDDLELFEHAVGEKSAQDVIDIIEGRK